MNITLIRLIYKLNQNLLFYIELLSQVSILYHSFANKKKKSLTGQLT